MCEVWRMNNTKCAWWTQAQLNWIELNKHVKCIRTFVLLITLLCFCFLLKKKVMVKPAAENISRPSFSSTLFNLFSSPFVVLNYCVFVCVSSFFVCLLNPIFQVPHFLFISCVTVYFWKTSNDDQVLEMMSCCRQIQSYQMAHTCEWNMKSQCAHTAHYTHIHTPSIFSANGAERETRWYLNSECYFMGALLKGSWTHGQLK